MLNFIMKIWDWAEGKKRNIAIGIGAVCSFGMFVEQEFSMHPSWLVHTLNVLQWIGIQIGVAGVASSMSKPKATV